MATKPWRSSGVLKDPSAARALARRLTRRDWRRLRGLLARPDLPVILKVMRDEQLRSMSRQNLPPRPWTQASAMSALLTHQDRTTLFGAIRLMQAAMPGAPPLGYAITPDQEPVRLDQALVLGYTGREIESVAAPSAGRQADAGWTGRPVLAQNALGLLGPNGPMPLAWSQHARALPSGGKARARESFVGFLNLVQRRQLALLYRAWSDALPITTWDAGATGTHPVEQRLSALAGLAHARLEERDGIPSAFKKAFAATLGRQVRGPGPLAAMLSRYLGHEATIREYSARWLDIPPEERTRLGQHCTRLGLWTETVIDPLRATPSTRDTAGEEAVLGRRAWDCSTCFEVFIGPVERRTYIDLLPGGTLYQEVRDLVALYMGPEWEWRLTPLLRAEEVPEGALGRPGTGLGWTHWLGRRPAAHVAGDLTLMMRPDLAPRRTDQPVASNWVEGA